jgi:hypothetical protein
MLQPPKRTKLEGINELERVGIGALLGQRRQMEVQVQSLTQQMDELDANGEKALAGRVPPGVRLADLHQDMRTGEITYLALPESPPPAP